MAEGKQVASLHAKIGADLNPLQKGLMAAKGELQGFTQNLGKAGEQIKSIGTKMSIGLSLPLAGLGAAMIKTTSDFEQNGNVLQSVIAANTSEMDMLRKQALQLGKDTVFSAAQASEAMLELGKSGLNATQIYEAMPGVLTLAAAANTTMGNAAQIAANAVNTFGLSAKDIPVVADTLAAAANASSVEIDDLRLSFSMAGAVMASSKMTFQETATVLGILGNNGIRGSDAGTSLKQMFLALETPSKQQNQIMSDLGFSIYDTSGKMLDMRGVIGNLELATQGLTQQQRDYVLGILFGSDAVRSANILLKEGVEGYDKMYGAVTRSGAAQEVADARMRGLAGAFEYFRGTLDTVLITAGTPWSETLSGMIKGIADLIGGFGDLSPEVQRAAVVIGAVLAVAGPVLVALGALASAVGALAPAFAVLMGPVGLITLAIGALGYAFATDFMGIRTNAMPVIMAVGDGMRTLAGIFADALGSILDTVGKIGGAIYEGLQWINPFARHSPSLVESWHQGSRDIQQDIGALVSSVKPLENAGQTVNGFGRDISNIGPASNSAKSGLDSLKSAAQGLKDKVSDLRNSLSDAQDMLNFFSTVPIEGMGAYDDAIFEKEQAIKRVEYEMLKFQHSGLGQDAMQPRYEEMKQYKQALEEQLRMMRLERELTFDPLERQRQQALKPRQEMPFQAIIDGIIEYKSKVSDLKVELEKNEKALAANQKIMQDISGLGAGPGNTYRDAAEGVKDLTKAYGELPKEPPLKPVIPPEGLPERNAWRTTMPNLPINIEVMSPKPKPWDELADAWGRLEKSKIPFVLSITNLAMAVHERKVEDTRKTWNALWKDLKEEVWPFFEKDLVPILKDTSDALSGDDGIAKALGENFDPLSDIVELYKQLAEWAENATRWLNNLASAIRGQPNGPNTNNNGASESEGETDTGGSGSAQGYGARFASRGNSSNTSTVTINQSLPAGTPAENYRQARQGAFDGIAAARAAGMI